jgi:hypothetical protein
MDDLDYLYAHHAVGLCPEERCVTAREGLAALVEERKVLLEIVSIVSRMGECSQTHHWHVSSAARAALQGRVASREGSGT